MTDTYRQKLRHWFASMGLLALVCTLALANAWIWTSLNLAIVGDDVPLDTYAGPMATGFLPYLVYFPPLAFWHLCDFLENTGREHRWRGWFSNYRSLVIFLLLASPVAIFATGNGFHLTGTHGIFCSNGNFEPPAMPLHFCSPSITEGLLVLIIAPLMALACTSKAITSVMSHLGGRK